eukprot:TRINITY_DN8387_c0_g1_i1.p1 TRINITY_DN8387_c0_g1~~TRINITY_DN8387_c0_g1_i1.p1  ORF type:complete len:469 (-),score=104.08 TRINITY_DN8387_c0_g1_i1:65-1471(-)
MNLHNATQWVISTYHHASFPRIPKMSTAPAFKFITPQKLIQLAIQRYTTFAVALVIFRRLSRQLPSMLHLAQKTMKFMMQFNRLVTAAERKRKMLFLLISYLSWPKALSIREMLTMPTRSNSNNNKRPPASLQTIVEGAVYQLCASETPNQTIATTTEVLDIVLVHGYGEDAVRTWIGPDDKQVDVWKAFAEHIKASVCNSQDAKQKKLQQKVRVLVLRYDDIKDQMRDVIEYLLLSLHYAQSAPSHSHKTIFIARGFGGNVVKDMLKAASCQPNKPYGGLHLNTMGVFFIGTIHAESFSSTFDLATSVEQIGGGYYREMSKKTLVSLDWIQRSNASFFSSTTDEQQAEETESNSLLHVWNNRILFYSVIPSSSSLSPELQTMCSVPERQSDSYAATPSPSSLYPHHISSIPANVNIKITQPHPTSSKQPLELWRFFASPTTFMFQSIASFIEKSVQRTDRILYSDSR